VAFRSAGSTSWCSAGELQIGLDEQVGSDASVPQIREHRGGVEGLEPVAGDATWGVRAAKDFRCVKERRAMGEAIAEERSVHFAAAFDEEAGDREPAEFGEQPAEINASTGERRGPDGDAFAQGSDPIRGRVEACDDDRLSGEGI
jgi:hypothetical protein